MSHAVTACTGSTTIKTEQALSRLSRLPAFNATAVKLLVQPFGEEDSIGAIEASFRSDPALAGQLLVAANSPAFGFRSQISTIRHALAVLGLERIRSLVATIATSSYMRRFPVEVVTPIWAHAVATATIAEYLAKYSDGISGSAMYTAGLMHDMGRLGLLASTQAKYEIFLFDEFDDRAESDLREREICGVTHTEAGGLLTHVWGFPQRLCQHAAGHHVEREDDTEEDQIVHAACLLADSLGHPEVRLRSIPERSAAAKWQGKRVDDACRELVARRIEDFLS